MDKSKVEMLKRWIANNELERIVAGSNVPAEMLELIQSFDIPIHASALLQPNTLCFIRRSRTTEDLNSVLDGSRFT